MISAHEASETVTESISNKEQRKKQKLKEQYEKILHKAILEEIEKNSRKVSRILHHWSQVDADILSEILKEKWYGSIEVKAESLDHDRYVDRWVSIQFSF